MLYLALDMDGDGPSGLAGLGIAVAKTEDIVGRCHRRACNISEIKLLLRAVLAE